MAYSRIRCINTRNGSKKKKYKTPEIMNFIRLCTHQRINFVWVAAKFAHSIPHACKINNCWDTSKIL